MEFEALANYNVKLLDVSSDGDAESEDFKITNIQQANNKIFIEAEMSGSDVTDRLIYIDGVEIEATITDFYAQFTIEIPKKLFDEVAAQGSMVLDHHSDDISIDFGDYRLSYKLDNYDEDEDITSIDPSKIKDELYNNYVYNYFYPSYHDDPEVKLKLSVEINN